MEQKNVYKDEHKSSWNELHQYYYDQFASSDRRWMYRGENPGSTNANETNKEVLRSKLDEAFDFFQIPEKKRLDIEKALFREFRRKQFLYTGYQPCSDVETLALMRHHDAPTRFLDWTYSFFVALYFAINRAQHYCIVWALDADWLFEQGMTLLERKNIKISKEQDRTKVSDELLKKFWESDDRYTEVHTMIPFYLNRRLAIQQGIFLCPGNIRVSWYENLQAMLAGLNTQESQRLFYRIVVSWSSSNERNQIIRQLFGMNITQATLFPDLDGFAMSLRTRLADPKSLPVPDLPDRSHSITNI